MKHYVASLKFASAVFLLLPLLCLWYRTPGASTSEDAFVSEVGAQMGRMMKNMDVKPSGDVDQDFVNMMDPHHRGAIDMARSELRYGKNEGLRRIAQGIIVEQQQEIEAMHLALKQKTGPAGQAETGGSVP